jgi:hypothetical protein
MWKAEIAGSSEAGLSKTETLPEKYTKAKRLWRWLK